MSTYLEERIQWYEENYRNGNALISDAQFDQLENNLKELVLIAITLLIKKIFHFLHFQKTKFRSF